LNQNNFWGAGNFWEEAGSQYASSRVLRIGNIEKMDRGGEILVKYAGKL
jgi:hypothetical protein